MPASTTPDIHLAKDLLRGTHLPPGKVLELAERLKEHKAFHLAWQVLARARRDPGVNDQPALRLRLAQR